MLTLEKVVNGLGSAGSSAYKDIYKAAKQAMSDRAMAVRTAAAKVNYILLNTSCFCINWITASGLLCFGLFSLTLVLLNPDIPCLCKQCRSRSVGF